MTMVSDWNKTISEPVPQARGLQAHRDSRAAWKGPNENNEHGRPFLQSSDVCAVLGRPSISTVVKY